MSSSLGQLKVIVVGQGVGGLTLALGLRQVGLETALYDCRPSSKVCDLAIVMLTSTCIPSPFLVHCPVLDGLSFHQPLLARE